MLKTGTVAEWILSLVSTRERAMTTVGDCLQDTRGAAAFWWFVLRTAVRYCWRDLAGSPWRLLGLGLCGLLTEAILFVALWLTGMSVWISMVHNRWGLDAVEQLPGWPAGLLGAVVGYVVVPFLAGRLAGRLSGGREVAVGIVCALLHTVFMVVHFSFGWSGALVISTGLMWVAALFVMAGALSWRAKHPRTA